jgi:predicted dehydrogenase
LEKIVFSIIGCGAIAHRHAKHISDIGVLDSVYDIDITKASNFANQHNCKYYNSYDELLAQTKASVVVICTPNYLHSPQTQKALHAGFHVICEKPMALNSIDCKQMIDAATKANKKLFVVKQNRYNPPVIELKKLLNKNILGAIINVQLNCFWNRDSSYYNNSSWKGKIEKDGGILYTQFSHFIDLLLWLLGDVTVVKTIGLKTENNAKVIQFDDNISCLVILKNGAIGNFNFTINAFAKNMEGSITIFAEKGTVKIGGEYLNKLEYQQINSYILPEVSIQNKANNYGTYTGSMSNHDKVYANVVNVLQNNAAIDVDMNDGLKTVECIENILSKF